MCQDLQMTEEVEAAWCWSRRYTYCYEVLAGSLTLSKVIWTLVKVV